MKALDHPLPKKKRTRTYRYVKSWEQNRPWLYFEEETGKMFCSTCVKFDKTVKSNAFRTGCTSFRNSVVESHETSESHKWAEAARFTSLMEAKDRPMEKVVLSMEQSEHEQMRTLFKTVFHLMQCGRPFTDLPKEVKFLKSIDVKLSDTYGNDKQCRVFADFIADDLRNRMRQVYEGQFFSILSDGSTDKSNTEEEIIYIRYIEDGLPVNRFVGLKSLCKANAENLTQVLIDTMEDDLGMADEKWKERLVACCFDGASVMLGPKSGVAKRLKDMQLPHLVAIHCCAHRLELAIKDVLKRADLMDVTESLLFRIYKHYKYSALNWAELQNAGEALHVSVKKPVDNKGTRWIGHHQRAVDVMKVNYPAIVTHMSEVVATVKGDRADRTAELLGEVEVPSFPLFLNFLAMYLPVMTRVSQSFQSPDLTISEVQNRLSAVYTQIQSYKDTSNDKLKTVILDGVKVDEENNKVSYNGAEIKFPRSGRARVGTTEALNRTLGEVIKEGCRVLNLTQQYMEERFKDLIEHSILPHTLVFQPHSWPKGEALASYGEESVTKLFQHFLGPLSAGGMQEVNALLQWTELKISVSKYMSASTQILPTSAIWQHFIVQDSVDKYFPDLLALVKICLLIPTNTADCERGFSLMGRIKTDWRCRLHASTTTSLMAINLHNEDVTDYNPDNAIALWWSSGKQKRRPHTKPYGPRKSGAVPDQPDVLTEQLAWDSEEED